MRLTIITAIAADALFALAAVVAARRCGARFQTSGLWLSALAVGPIACAAVSFRHGSVVAAAIAICAACVSAQTDLQCGLIFDTVTLGALAALLFRAAGTGTLAAACVGCVALAALLGALWAASGGRGIGLGDVKFAAVVGAAFGCAWGAAALGAAFVTGGIAAAALLLGGRATRRTALPLAPFFAIGCILSAATGGSLS